MKLLHIADLHIGKRVNEFTMIGDQQYVLEQILEIVRKERPEGILIAGDVYDKSQPAVEAVELLDRFLTELTALGPAIFMISGNHDSPERLSFGSRIMEKNRLYIVGTFDGALPGIPLKDAYGAVTVHLLPFIKPAMVRRHFEQPPETYDDAVRMVLSAADIDTRERNILLAHQFVTNGMEQPERSDSENLSVGGLDNVDVSAFAGFDYVALGHLHRPQSIGTDAVRYAGSPLKYSFSEARGQKSATLLELGEKGAISIRLLPLNPLHDLREIKGPMAELLRIGKEESSGAEDYIHAILTDEEEMYDAVGQLREVYPNLMALDFENSRTGQDPSVSTAISGDVNRRLPIELYAEFYKKQNNSELSAEGMKILEQIFERAGGSAV